MKTKMWITFGLLIALLGGIAAHLFQLSQNTTIRTAQFQNSRTLVVATSRGTIYDRNRIPLTNNRWEYRAALLPEESLLTSVKESVTSTDFAALRDKLATGSPAWTKLSGPIALQDGMALFRVPVRYGNRVLAPHLIGYLDSSGQMGVSGLEASYDALLRSYAGQASATFAIDGAGRCLTGINPTINQTIANSEGGIILTIDSKIQQIVEDNAPDYLKKGAVVVMDPYSGEIIAMASFPTFQPDTVGECIEKDNGALLNRALSLYDCGSVFKIVTTACALENGISTDQSYCCDGAYDVEGVLFHCHNRLGHQSISMPTAFAQSCNLYFIQLAKSVSANALYATASNFGFCRSITIADGFSTPKATLPSRSVLQSDSALANLSFGQGSLTASPLHIAQTVAAIVNDGVMPVPYLVASTINEIGEKTDTLYQEGTQVVTEKTAKIIRLMMEKTVSEGTGKAAASNVCSIAGKTGTAETGQVSTDGDNPVVQSWFAGYFPADDPMYVITVLGEDAGNTNAKTTALVKKLAEEIYLITQ